MAIGPMLRITNITTGEDSPITKSITTNVPIPTPTMTPIPTPTMTSTLQHITYNSKIDPNNGGFYQIRCFNLTGQIQCPNYYYNRTLFIDKGDTVVWINDANEDLSIISEQGLWSGAEKLEKTKIFNDTGEYTFYIKEYSNIRQKIIVKSNISE